MNWQRAERELIDALRKQGIDACKGASGDWFVVDEYEINLTELAREVVEFKGLVK